MNNSPAVTPTTQLQTVCCFFLGKNDSAKIPAEVKTEHSYTYIAGFFACGFLCS